jgi:outer membrane protein assembly factor BamA
VRVPRVAAEEPGVVTKARETLEALHRRGLYPEVDTIVSASGLAFGGTYRSPSWAGISAEAGLMWSVRNYREYVVRVGRIGQMRHTVRLDPATDEVTSKTNVHSRKTTGTALYLEARRFNYRRVDYYGVDPALEGPRADYAVIGGTADVVGHWQPTTRMGLSARGGLLDVAPDGGTNSSIPDVGDAYSEISAPGLRADARYATVGVGGAFDTRDSAKVPTRGAFLSGSLWHFGALNDVVPSFTRFTADARLFFPVSADRKHVLAAAVVASADRTPGARPVPFYLQSWFGGSHTLRQFSSYRLRGESLLHVSVEHRWRVVRFVEVAPFVDIGGVSSTGRSLADGPLYTAIGAGLRFRTDGQVWARLDFAFSEDGSRLFLSWSPSF